jgi:hypothetical protein
MAHIAKYGSQTPKIQFKGEKITYSVKNSNFGSSLLILRTSDHRGRDKKIECKYRFEKISVYK